jgi:phosphoglycolate phosphatase
MSTRLPSPAVLWDLDGTLVDSAADIASAIDHTLAARGLAPIGLARVRGFIGDGARYLVERSWAAAGGTAGPDDVAAFLAYYAEHLVDTTHLHPPDIVELLARIDAPQAVVTNKPEANARRVLETLGLTPYFPVVIGGDTLPTRKPDPAMLHEALQRLGATRGVLVGDGPADVGAARAAGMWMIGVDWGIGQPVGADVRVGTVQALRAALAAAGVAGC